MSGIAAGATTSLLQGGRVNVVQVVADAFGNALGQSLNERAISLNGTQEDVLGRAVASNAQAWGTPATADGRSSYTNAVYNQLVDAFSEGAGLPNTHATGGMLFAGPGAPASDSYDGALPTVTLPTIHVTPNDALADAATGMAYGVGYAGVLSAWSPGSEWNEVDLNASAFRSPAERSAVSSWDAMTRQKDVMVASGMYDAFSAIGHAITDAGTLGQRVERFAHAMTYESPVAAQRIATTGQTVNPGAAALDSMLGGGPFAGIAGGLAYALGGTNQDAYYASQLTGSVEGVAADVAGYKMPRALQPVGSAANARGTGDGMKGLSSRLSYMGGTPDKYSRAGLEVVERMRNDGLIVGDGPLLRGNPNNLQLVTPGGATVPIDANVDIAHRIDAVTWWNDVGRFYGPKAPEVRQFMLNSENYVLEPRSINQAAGARLAQTYQPPVPPDMTIFKR